MVVLHDALRSTPKALTIYTAYSLSGRATTGCAAALLLPIERAQQLLDDRIDIALIEYDVLNIWTSHFEI